MPVSVSSATTLVTQGTGAATSTGGVAVALTANTAATLAPALSTRKGVVLTAVSGNSTPVLVNFGATATTVAWTLSLAAGQTVFIERDFWVGLISGISTAAATVQVTVTNP